jgi:4,5-DOPA dioxygenase extradiol
MKMPVLFVGHGSPMNAIAENAFTRSLQEVRKKLPEPKAICVVSAHWVTSGCQVLAADWPRTIHDFYGFPRPLYEVQYPAPGAPEEAKRLAMEQHLLTDHLWGFDHGAWSVLRHLYPEANVPVFEVSLDHARTFEEHLALGSEMKKLLHKINWEMPNGAYPWAEEFDGKVKKAIEERDVKSLAAPNRWGSGLLAEAHPTLEHYAPVLYCLGATDETDAVSYPHEGIEFGTISMRMALFENRSS